MRRPGITTPAIPSWERPENYRGLRFETGKSAVERVLAEVCAHESPDLVIVAAHAGLERDPKTGEAKSQDLANENMVYEIATSVPGEHVTVMGSMQCPYYVQKALAPLFGLPNGKIRVIQTETGGGFGGSVVMLARAGAGRTVAERIATAYAKCSGQQPKILVPEIS